MARLQKQSLQLTFVQPTWLYIHVVDTTLSRQVNLEKGDKVVSTVFNLLWEYQKVQKMMKTGFKIQKFSQKNLDMDVCFQFVLLFQVVAVKTEPIRYQIYQEVIVLLQ
eukprot:TRINITY_DN8645_c0_g1_i5.p6 TRINITY_DN8645_c0_g1~~TRINITY_DN8645_c0_g1_i5.p6  ORF type:complete len:108 (-),score=0.65 TRINITY_DN8645_c0_g1_i5:2368-2691(-)